jgi:UDP-3-O-[3-hydroxymyristoyl] glucosamine N-acyltransferase
MAFSAQEAAAWCNGRVEGSADRIFDSMEALEFAGPRQLTFLGHAVYARQFAKSKAGGAVCADGLPAQRRDDQTLIWTDNADLAVARILEKLAPHPPLPELGLDPTAIIEPGAVLGKDVRIGPYVVIQSGARIGDRSVLMAQTFIGAGASLGEDCLLWPQVVVRNGCTIGRRVILHSGCVIGADGFGYRFADGRFLKIPQIGGVRIEDDCELGANTCVDRGKFSDTIVGQGSKLDNLVQVAHNVRLGKHTILAAHVAIGGSVRAGDYLMMGGGAVASDHLVIGPGVQVAGFSAVVGDVAPGEKLAGTPARPGKKFFAELRAYFRLPDMLENLRRLEQRIAKLESSSKNHSS